MWLRVELDVRRASAKNAYCVYGHPSPFAFIGFAVALSLKCKMTQRSGVLAVIHSCDFHASPPKYGQVCFDLQRSAQRDCRPTRGVKGKSQFDTPMADLRVSLAFEFETASMDGLGERIDDALLDMRFAGGVIANARFRTAETSDEAFRFSAGFVMVEATVDTGTDDLIDRFNEKISIEKGKPGWYTPSLLGFRLIESPADTRVGARGGHPHAYADPLIGIVQFFSARKATVDDMWRIQRNDDVIRFVTPSLAARTQQSE